MTGANARGNYANSRRSRHSVQSTPILPEPPGACAHAARPASRVRAANAAAGPAPIFCEKIPCFWHTRKLELQRASAGGRPQRPGPHCAETSAMGGDSSKAAVLQALGNYDLLEKV